MTRAAAYLLVSLLLAGCPGEKSVNPKSPLEETKEQATQGDAKAQTKLGDIYRNGEGVPKDYVEAVFWFRKAAEQGEAEAQFALGDMYRIGRGLPRSVEQAVLWYRIAAEQGDAEAQNYLGVMYDRGAGVPKDYVQAVFWFRKAAEQGYAPAQFNLGSMYQNGQGVPKEEIEAYAWYNIASVSNDVTSTRDALEEAMTPEARMRGQARSRELQKLIEERKAAKGK